eukprot:jgi/Botrbrau1/14145/Bobra.182_3s0086.1
MLDAVKKSACNNNEVALSIDSNIAGKLLTDVSELFSILTRLFKPDQHGYLAALRSKRQQENQPAAEFMNEIKGLGYKHWIGLPDKEEVFEMIISSMSDKHHGPFMRSKLETMHVAMQAQENPKPITFANLLTWALDSDAEFAANLLHQRRTNNAQGAKVNNSQGDPNDKKNFQDNRSSNYRGRGRGNGRGYANYNQPFEEKSPFSFMLQLNVSDEDSDLDVNICDLSPDDETESDKEDKVGAKDPDFVPLEIDNRKPAIYVPGQVAVKKRKRTVTALTPNQAQASISDVLPCPPTPVGEQFLKLDPACMSNLRTNKSAPKSPPLRKVIRKPRASAKKTAPASKTPAGLPPLITRGRKPRHTKQVQAMIKEGMELLAGAFECIDTAAKSNGVDKGKRPMTPAECAAYENSKKNSGKPQLPKEPVPMEMEKVTFLPRVEPPPHPTAFRNVPLYTDECWKLPLPDSARVAEKQKDLC